jgi:hypothetical protein
MLTTVVLLRAWLGLTPNADFNVGRYNVHHLFVGLLLIVACGVPLALGRGASRLTSLLTVGFGAGLGLALDEWVYLIATDGSNASYLLPVSLWGSVVMVGLAAGYVVLLSTLAKRGAKGG